MKYFIIFLIFSLNVFSYDIEIGQVLEKNGVFEVPIVLKSAEPFQAMQFTIEYEKGLKYEGFEWGEAVSGALNALNDKVEGQIKGALASGSQIKSTGTICKIRFSGKGKVQIKDFLIDDKKANIKTNEVTLKKIGNK